MPLAWVAHSMEEATNKFKSGSDRTGSIEIAEATGVSDESVLDILASLEVAKKLPGSIEETAVRLRSHGIKNVAYLVLNLPSVTTNDRPLMSMTYHDDWKKRYAQKNYADVDPILKAGLSGILPIDWDDIDRSDPVIRQFFGEAQELDVGSRGLSIPIRGRNSEFALFTVTSDMSEREWKAEKRSMMRELMLASWQFHSSIIDEVLLQEKPVSLSHREASCLRFKALGKSDQDVAEILGISKSTVRFHIESARSRLGANNVIQAVAKALTFGLINLVVEPPGLVRR